MGKDPPEEGYNIVDSRTHTTSQLEAGNLLEMDLMKEDLKYYTRVVSPSCFYEVGGQGLQGGHVGLSQATALGSLRRE